VDERGTDVGVEDGRVDSGWIALLEAEDGVDRIKFASGLAVAHMIHSLAAYCCPSCSYVQRMQLQATFCRAGRADSHTTRVKANNTSS